MLVETTSCKGQKVISDSESPHKGYKKIFRGYLDDHQVSLLPSGFDVVGDILIIRLPTSLRDVEDVVGQRFIERFSSIKTVCTREHNHSIDRSVVRVIALRTMGDGKATCASTLRYGTPTKSLGRISTSRWRAGRPRDLWWGLSRSTARPS